MVKIEDLDEYRLISNAKNDAINSMVDHPHMKDMLLHICSCGGKNIRSLMLLLSSEICGGRPEESINAALAIEFIHSASLIHDDVLDGGLLRRGVESVHRKYGIPAAILCGDFLISRAISLMSGYGSDAVNEFGKAGMYMAEGEVIDISGSGVKFTEQEYFECITKKTGSLFAASACIGAYVAGADNSIVQNLRLFGENVGNAYQIVDDLLEYLDELSGKDSKYGSVTLPIIYREKEGHENAVIKTVQNVRIHVRDAKDILFSFPPSDARDLLELITDLITIDMLPVDIINFD